MADASKLIPFILKWEGGFVNSPTDKGGATNKGITLATFRQYYGKNKTVNDLKNITDEQWFYIFKKGYWFPFKGDYIENQSVANACVDWAFNSGVKTAARQVQQILAVTADGIVGNQTLAAINAYEPRELFDKIKAARTRFVNNIVRNNPAQAKHIKGWINRINAITFQYE